MILDLVVWYFWVFWGSRAMESFSVCDLGLWSLCDEVGWARIERDEGERARDGGIVRAEVLEE